MPKPRRATADGPLYDARPDPLDFRDLMYEASLVEVPVKIDIAQILAAKHPVLDQGSAGACTGFGLAAVANHLLRSRRVLPDSHAVSPRMFYEMAKRHDEWSGAEYSGSSARGAMKGWHKHGVCSDALWPFDPTSTNGSLTDERARDAARRPLGAYYRVPHQDLVSMHAALVETGVLYVTATVHEGWTMVGSDGVIPFAEGAIGAHAFAIVGYDERGFWLQNSSGAAWGRHGYGLLSYRDCLANGTDAWVARLGAPVLVEGSAGAAQQLTGSAHARASSIPDLRPHIISLGNDGVLLGSGMFATSLDDVKEIVRQDFPRITAGWSKKRILLYAHGGLVDEAAAVQRVAEYLGPLVSAEVYPIAFIWHTDFWSTLTNMLQDAFRRIRPEGFLDAAKDFMLDRLDDALEPIARSLVGKAEWSEMKENARLATTAANGGARAVLDEIIQRAQGGDIEVHIAGHSAGSIFHGPVVRYLQAAGVKIESCTLWAPACTMDLFDACYLPAIEGEAIKRFAIFTLTDKAEQDDNCAGIYHKSLLYLVSNAFEATAHIPLLRDGVPLLGMQRFVAAHTTLPDLIAKKRVDHVLAPNTEAEGSRNCSGARHHGDFDDDAATVASTLLRILGTDTVPAGPAFAFTGTAEGKLERRSKLKQ